MPSVAHACPDDESGPVSAVSRAELPAGLVEDAYRIMKDLRDRLGLEEDPVIAWYVDEASTVDVSKPRPTPALLKQLQEAAQQRRGEISTNSGAGKRVSPSAFVEADRVGLITGMPRSGKSLTTTALALEAGRRAALGPAPRSQS